MKKYDHPEKPELSSASRNPFKKNPFRQILHRCRFDRAECAFNDLADHTAWLLIDTLAKCSDCGRNDSLSKQIAADLSRLNDLLELLIIHTTSERTLRLWCCIRRYDQLCSVVTSKA